MEYDKNNTIEQPSLEQKYLNMTKGRTDVMIKCQKIGKTYLQICNEKRDTYVKSDFKNQAILYALQNVKQLFEDNKPVIQDISKELKIPKKKLVTTEPVEERVESVMKPEVTLTGVVNEAEMQNHLVEQNSTSTEKPLRKKSLLIKKEEE